MTLTRDQLNDLRTTVYDFVASHPRYAASTIQAEVSTKWNYPNHAVKSALAYLVRAGLLVIIQGGSPDFGAIHSYPAYVLAEGNSDVNHY